MLRSLPIPRRDFLKGISLGGSAAVLGPMLNQLQAASKGEPPPRRVVFVMVGNGILSQSITPPDIARPTKLLSGKQITDAEKFRSLPLADLKLPADFEPLADYKDRLSILLGLSGRACQGGHSNNFGALGVYGANSGPAGITVDCALAKSLPAPFPHLGLGITRNPDDGVVYNVSAWDRGSAAPIQCKPTDAHHALFGSVSPAGKDDFATLPCVLDFMTDDLKRVESNLAGPEREKLQAYVHALEGIGGRHSAIREKDPVLRKLAPALGPKYTSATETDKLEAHAELGTAALIAGLTNVLVIAAGCGNPYFEVTYKGLGIGVNMHTIGHGQGEKDKSAVALTGIIRRFQLGLVARLADRLKAIPEGTGTMLDNTAIVILSDAGDGHHAANWEYPMMILGDLGGRLKTRGRYIEFPHYGRAGHRTIASLYCTLLHAAGTPRDKFGVMDSELEPATQTGPISELLN
ncbi:DUF1552 domain-containing protein [Gemmata sp.]|uniref:DUF1552 domain-containing protein n=1 Tax=Gemmata sp. TaxID=1914242 RepID=UPI003F6F4425